MSAVPRPRQPLLLPMSLLHLDAVMAIEAGAYPFPWTHGNFVDSLAAGYDARVLYDDEGAILGYFVAMAGVEEMHLLNITVAPRAWHLGHGRFMLDALEALCRERGARQLWLEVRVSNERAPSTAGAASPRSAGAWLLPGRARQARGCSRHEPGHRRGG